MYPSAVGDGMSEIIWEVGMRFVPSERPGDGLKLSVEERPLKEVMVVDVLEDAQELVGSGMGLYFTESNRLIIPQCRDCGAAKWFTE